MRFGDPQTADLVRAALEHNTDLQTAAARVLEASAALRQATGASLPQVTAGISGARTKTSFVLPGIGRTSIYSTTFSDDLSVSWQADLFGKLKRTRQQAWATLLAEAANREALEHSIIAAVVRARIQIATLERTLEVTRSTRTSWERTLATVERRYRSGLARAVDVHLARENLAATQGREVQVDAQLEQARHALHVLVGQAPGSLPPLHSDLPDVPGLEPVPVGLPADLLDRRPDLRRAEAQLSAATYGVGAAIADLFPSLTLSGSTGATSDSLSDLLSTDGLVYSAVANLVAPIFTGGQRRAGVDAARARAEAAAATYSGAVLTALREVEDALVADRSIQSRLDLAHTRLEQARAADRIARERYQRGVETLLTVLETERRLRAAEDAMLAVTAEVWNTRIDLFLALGGDWTAALPSTSTMEPTDDSEV
jgi:NodT family efflux transporter outer membrane factor (OMF) lipoprotein